MLKLYLHDCCSLWIHTYSIQKAFLKAATTVRSHIFHNSDDESEGDCINDPWPGNESEGDRLIGITTEADPPSACALKKGSELPEVIGDEVVTAGREGIPDQSNIFYFVICTSVPATVIGILDKVPSPIWKLR
ncbi:unnamed protein product [Lactuca virosa]|uniref:Uncharacterized protein n=1 Tax=Lactuca virosa TaxID=75947 RepID=A0AAU9M2X0_9ASTR|nr:unnamed protein product [Lactuca virosa]